MKREPIAFVLLALLFGLSAFNLVLAVRYGRATSQSQALQMNVAEINRYKAQLQALAQESMLYSRRNPAIDPVLQSVGLKGPRTNRTSTLGAP